MEKEYNITTVIPARAGSERLPGKNFRPIAGKPMIQYTIDAVNDSFVIGGNNVVLSTNDPQVSSSIRGARNIRKRPEHLATAAASQVDVVIDAVDWMAETGIQTDVVILLQPTSPLRSAADIDAAVNQFINEKAESLVSVSFVQELPYDMLDGSGNILKSKRENYLYLNGAIYIINMATLRQRRGFYFPRETALYFMPKWRSIDVDDEEDFIVAEKIMLGGAHNAG